MRKLLNLVPFLIVAIVFAPSLLINRYAGDRPLSTSDIAFMLPLVAYFFPLLTINKFMQNSYTYLSKEDKRNYSILAIGLTGFMFILWLIVLFSSAMPLSLAASTTAAFIFAAYDLLRLINGLQKSSELGRIVWLHVFLPCFAAVALWVAPVVYTHWLLVPNPVAAFFVLRAILMAVDKPFTAQVLQD